ncbi:MAG: DUF5107 domain-containing protein [Chitinophagaceae bacterium]|nr:DUF5107 domain-containing protein [Chitinophagaceae bacterium]MCW5925691.1 DUF5107 domain-containing protein [Chitinophagaceae bacterium]
MKKMLVSIFVLLNTGFIVAQQNSVVKEYSKEFLTYPFSDPSPIALLSEVYPYFRYDGFTDSPVKKQWKVVELENDFLQVMILPEVGGKIWAAIEKRNGKSFIYYNQVVKFRDIGMRGPWTSGGLEANYGIIGHTPNTATPVDYTTRSNPDGSVSCIIGVLDLLTRSQWRIEINLPKDKAYFTTKSFWYNQTGMSQPYYHWMNLGMPSKGNLEFIFPGTHYIGHGGEHANWPINKENGKQINFYEQNDFGGPKSYHVIGKPADFFGAYYHDTDNGMVRYGTYDDKAGRKIWIWGLARQGMIWEKLLTDTDGQYVEIQSGRLFNQNATGSNSTPFKQTNFAPYATDTWTEYWYPVSGTRGMVKGNDYGALNIQSENGWTKIYLSAVQKLNDRLEIRSGGKTLYSKNVQIDPLQVFADSVKLSIPGNAVAILGDNKLVYDFDTHADALNRPLEGPTDFDWSSAYGEYLMGRQLMDQKLYARAEKHLEASLEKDHNFLPALVKTAALQYRKMLHKDALATIKRALQIDTHSGEANYYYGLINEALGNAADAKDGYSLATLTQEYKSAAYTALARLSGREKQYPQSIAYAEKALDYNRYNLDALMLEAVAWRNRNNPEKAQPVLQTILQYDPLNHFSLFEKYLLQPTESNKQAFISSVRNELPYETFSELAIWYYNAGYNNEALELFRLSPASAEAALWTAFLKNERADCKSLDPSFAFPFRSETGKVLEHLIAQQDDWFLKYQLALVYRDRNRIEECRTLLNACGTIPDFAPFYATRGALAPAPEEKLKDLQKALSLQSTEWRYHKLLAEYYISHRQPAAALAITEPFYKKNRNNMIMGMLYAKTLLLNKKYKEVDALLTSINIIPFEGATEGRMLYREAKLMQAIEALNKGNSKRALTFTNAATLWPENLGVGKPYENEIDYRLENWLRYLAGNKKSDRYLDEIIGFTPVIENTIRNFIPSNALVTAWALEKKKNKTEALAWLNGQIEKFPQFEKALQWSKSMFEKSADTDLSEDHKDAGMRILEAVKMIH